MFDNDNNCLFFGFSIRFIFCDSVVDADEQLHVADLQEVAELRRQIAIEQAAKQKKEKVLDADVLTEFECCYCTTKVCANFSTIHD